MRPALEGVEWGVWGTGVEYLRDLEDENIRLRAALEKIAKYPKLEVYVVSTAREALSSASEEEA